MTAGTPYLNAQNQNAPDDFPRARIYDPPAAQLEVTTVARNDIDWALRTLAAHREDYQLYHDYLRGDHRLVFATSEYRAVFKKLLEGLRCNVCPAVVHALTDRLNITNFKPHANEADQTAAT